MTASSTPMAGSDVGQLLALAERLEAAAEPDRELDAEIMHLIDAMRGPLDAAFGPDAAAPRYTSSLSAAITLGKEAEAVLALREAFSFTQIAGYPTGGFIGVLARATAAGLLRTRATANPIDTLPLGEGK